MNIKVLHSGSDGNCVWIGNGANSILVDAGLQKSKTESILLENEIDPTRIDAMFVTHEHGDHVRGLSFADKYKIPVFASEGTLKQLGRLESGRKFAPGQWQGFGDLIVRAFRVSHDALDPYGYIVQSRDCRVCVLMDTGTVTEEMIAEMRYCDVYVFECNHDVDMLEASAYHDGLKARIKSDVGHLSNDQAAAALARLVTGNGERLYLTHMSDNNNLPALAEATVKRALRAKGFVPGKHFTLEVV